MTVLDPPRFQALRPTAAARHRAGSALVRGRAADPVWVRPALLGLLAATALLYLWGLGASGWGNSFYSAAVQAGSTSWKAFFFGSFDAANAITVDKPPAALWVMEISARIFGVNAWSILAPQALIGVASVGVLYAAVRRHFPPLAGLLAGAVLALTPVAALMFRFNNPDALLVLLLVGSAYAVTRALEAASTRWLALAGALVGFAFLTKMLQAFLVLPAFALVYLLAAPTPLRRRIVQLLVAGAALVVSAGWWIAIVALWPASSRPYIGGSQNNSILELVLGYNGLGRITGNETGSVGGGGNGGSMWGETGWTRMFSAEYGGQVAWLLPAALVLLVALIWMSRRARRDDPRRAVVYLWGGWLLVTGLVFSFMQGIIHAYYSVALAPAIGALVGIGAVTLWQLRGQLLARLALGGTVALTAVWTARLLDRSPNFLPWLRPVVLIVGLAAAAAIAAANLLDRRVLAVAGTAAVLASGAGTAAYAVDTATTPHTGSIPSAGPAVAGGRGFGPGGNGPGGGRGLQGGTGTQTFAPPQGGTTGGPGGPGRQGGLGGLLDSATPSSALVSLIQTGAGNYRWAAAAVGSNNAAGVQLASGEPVMAIGGFNGSDPSPTLAEFQAYVAQGKIHYFLGGGGFGGMGGGSMGGSSDSSSIASWVAANFTAQTVGGVTVYDLTAGTSAS